MDPMMMASLAQMGMNFGQGVGGWLGGGGTESLGQAFQGSLLGGYLSGKSAKKKKKKAQQRFKRALRTTESIQGRNLQQQEALARQATSQELAGYDQARKEASRMGRSAKRSALDRETQLGGQISQNLQNRGLSSTTAGSNLSRGLAADTSRVLGDIDEGLAGMFGDLALGRSQVESAGTQRLAGLADARAGLSTQLAQMNLLGGATLGSLGSFDPGAWTNPAVQNVGPGMMEGFGSLMGSMGGGGGMGGQMNPEMLKLLQQLFSQGGGSFGQMDFVGPPIPPGMG